MKPFADILAQRTTRLPNGCLRWDRALSNGSPAYWQCEGGNNIGRSVRREVWKMRRGPLSKADWVRAMCGNARCVEISHLTTERRPPKTLADRIRDNATVLPNGCIRWDGWLHPQRECTPIIGVRIAKNTLRQKSVRRMLWIEAGREIGLRDAVRPVCPEPLCVNLDHLARFTRTDLNHIHRPPGERCRSGRHDLTVEANVRRAKNGKRNGCVPCLREKQRAYSIAERDDGRLSVRKRRQTVPDGPV